MDYIETFFYATSEGKKWYVVHDENGKAVYENVEFDNYLDAQELADDLNDMLGDWNGCRK